MMWCARIARAKRRGEGTNAPVLALATTHSVIGIGVPFCARCYRGGVHNQSLSDRYHASIVIISVKNTLNGCIAQSVPITLSLFGANASDPKKPKPRKAAFI